MSKGSMAVDRGLWKVIVDKVDSSLTYTSGWEWIFRLGVILFLFLGSWVFYNSIKASGQIDCYYLESHSTKYGQIYYIEGDVDWRPDRTHSRTFDLAEATEVLNTLKKCEGN